MLLSGCSVSYGKITPYINNCDEDSPCSKIVNFDKSIMSCSRYDKTCLVNSKTQISVSNPTQYGINFRVSCYFYIDGISMEEGKSKYLFLGSQKSINIYFYYVFTIPSFSSSNIGVRCPLEYSY
jgi:hypothetical protein